jgi:hypothetical protein
MTTCGYVQTVVKILHNTENRNIGFAPIVGREWTERTVNRMKCVRCPLYHYWSNESDSGEACAIFGDGWDSPFQYEDKYGTTVGCYLDRHFIEKADAERDEYYAAMAERRTDEV